MKYPSHPKPLNWGSVFRRFTLAFAMITWSLMPALASGKKAVPAKEAPPPFVVLDVDSGRITVDTLQLPDQVARPGQDDSLSKEFAKYWAQLEKQEGMAELKKQMRANDIDKTKIPHLYLADSNLVIFPGWFILRKKP